MNNLTKHRLFTVDVFNTTRFLGNPLGVVVHRGTLSGQQMQAVAREINYSETTFVPQSAVDAVLSGTADRLPMRIFTTTRELPFAGHPVVGTAWVLCERLGLPAPLSLDIPAGMLNVASEDGGFAFDTPVPELQAHLPAEEVAAIAGISMGDLASGLRPQQVTGGPAFVLAPLMNSGSLYQLTPNLERIRNIGARTGTVPALYAFAVAADATPDTAGAIRVDARMFFDAGGLHEDPATGSAAAALGAYLRAQWPARLPFDLAIHQGVAMGRASLLRVAVTADALRLSGAAVPVIEGHIWV